MHKKIIWFTLLALTIVMYNSLPRQGIQDHLEFKDNQNSYKSSSGPKTSLSDSFRGPAGNPIINRSGKSNSSKNRRSSSKQILDGYPRTKLIFEDLYVLSNVVADFNPKPLLKITEVAGVSVYENAGALSNNVIFDSGKGLYCVWSGVIALSADSEVARNLTEKFPLEFLESVGPTHLYKMVEGFDLTKDLPELIKTDGVGDVNLDLKYARFKPR